VNLAQFCIAINRRRELVAGKTAGLAGLVSYVKFPSRGKSCQIQLNPLLIMRLDPGVYRI